MKRINEAKFRSPKWLRNYLDFEVNTGDDITGQPSERRMNDTHYLFQNYINRSQTYYYKSLTFLLHFYN